MGIPDGAHTHGSDGSGLGTVVLVIVAAALLGPAVAAAVAELVHIVLIIGAAVAALGAAGLAGLLAFRVRRRLEDAARAEPPNLGAVSPLHRTARAAPPLLRAQRPPVLPIESGREVPGGFHLHFHGVNAEDVAALLARALPRPGVNRKSRRMSHDTRILWGTLTREESRSRVTGRPCTRTREGTPATACGRSGGISCCCGRPGR
jgi:hypothetical protein